MNFLLVANRTFLAHNTISGSRFLVEKLSKMVFIKIVFATHSISKDVELFGIIFRRDIILRRG